MEQLDFFDFTRLQFFLAILISLVKRLASTLVLLFSNSRFFLVLVLVSFVLTLATFGLLSLLTSFLVYFCNQKTYCLSDWLSHNISNLFYPFRWVRRIISESLKVHYLLSFSYKRLSSRLSVFFQTHHLLSFLNFRLNHYYLPLEVSHVHS